MNERTAIGGGSGGSGRRTGPIAEAFRIWGELPAEEKTGARRERLMKLFSVSEAFRLTNVRAGQNAKAGNPGPEGSIAKLALSNFNKTCTEFCIDLMGANALIDYDYTFRRPEQLSVDGMDHGIRYSFLRARANSIEGGTTEIMKNILGEQMLGLPGEPRVDKDLPWSKVPRN
jgi:alkylation response protein AidB-like acyl-CoA dehydrogenase